MTMTLKMLNKWRVISTGNTDRTLTIEYLKKLTNMNFYDICFEDDFTEIEVDDGKLSEMSITEIISIIEAKENAIHIPVIPDYEYIPEYNIGYNFIDTDIKISKKQVKAFNKFLRESNIKGD